jgi:hypothetical protein
MLHPITLTTGTPESRHHITCLQTAHQAVVEEREVLQTEADAFGDFCARLDQLSCERNLSESATPTATTHETITGQTTAVNQHGDTPIRDAYVETVMNTPHYDEEYGDSFWESLTAEFGNEFATLLKQVTVITPELKQQVLTAAQQAKTQRKRLISTLNQEVANLQDANAELQAIADEVNVIQSRPFYDCPTDELYRLRTDLDELSLRCQDLADRRQNGELEPQSANSLKTNIRVPDYCYGSLSVTYPILDAVATISSRIATTKQHIITILDETPS